MHGMNRRWLGSPAREAWVQAAAKARVPRHLAGVSATRAGPAPQAGRCGPERGRREVGPLDARAPGGGCSAHGPTPFQGRPREGRISGTGSRGSKRTDGEVGEGGWPGG